MFAGRSLAGLLPSSLRKPDLARQPLLSREDILDLAQRAEYVSGQNKSQAEVAHKLYGDNRSVYRGYGLDFEESRNYQPGDEIRFMNWRLTARLGEPYMKVFREERRPGVFILLDRRTSMRFGTRTRLKASQAARAATLAAFRARREHTTIGGVMLEHQPVWLQDTLGENGAYALAFAAAHPCPPVTTTEDSTALGRMLRLLSAMLVPGSRIYLISDFSDLAQSDYATLLQLASEHAISSIHICDPAETEIPEAGNLRLFSHASETGINFDSHTKKQKSVFKQAAQQFVQEREAILRSTGCLYTRLSTEVDSIENEIIFHG